MVQDNAGVGLYLQEGYQLQDYRLVSVLGKGGFGVTYLAEDMRLGRKVAIKEYFPFSFSQRSSDGIGVTIIETARTRFQLGLKHFNDEGRVLARFHHPAVVGINGYLEANGTAYLVMDFEDGDILPIWLGKTVTRLSESDAITLLKFIGSGLKHIHEYGYLHLDIKPNNIIIHPDRTPVLIDFGAARYALGVHTRILTLFISPGYSAIEQYSEDSLKGAWTDIYALAAVFYEILIGKRPPDAVVRQRHDTLVSAVEAGRTKYSRQFMESLDWALRVEPADRPQKIEDWLQKLEDGKVSTPISKYLGKSNFYRLLLRLAVVDKARRVQFCAAIALSVFAVIIGYQRILFYEVKHSVVDPVSVEAQVEKSSTTGGPDAVDILLPVAEPASPDSPVVPNANDLADANEERIPFMPKLKPQLLSSKDIIVADITVLPVAGSYAGHGYFIIAGSFAIIGNAEETAHRLRDRGLPVAIIEIARLGKRLHVIKVGPFAGRDEAKARAAVIESVTREKSILVKN